MQIEVLPEHFTEQGATRLALNRDETRLRLHELRRRLPKFGKILIVRDVKILHYYSLSNGIS